MSARRYAGRGVIGWILVGISLWLPATSPVASAAESAADPGASSGVVALEALEEIPLGDLLSRLEGSQGAERITLIAAVLGRNLGESIEGAAELGREALTLLGEHPDSQLELHVRLSMTWALAVEGQAEAAVPMGERARELAAELGDDEMHAHAYYFLAVADWYSSNVDAALANAEEALRRQERLDDVVMIGRTCTLLGAIHRARDDFETALDYHVRAWDLAEAQGHEAGVARSRNNIGLLYRDLGQSAVALPHLRAAAVYYREAERVSQLATVLSNVGLILIELKQPEEALASLEEALEAHRNFDRPRARAKVLSNFAFAYEKLGDEKRALEYHERTLTLREEIGDQRGLSRTLGSLGKIYSQRGEYQRAGDYLQRGMAAAKAVDARSEQVAMLEMLARIYEAQGELESALDATRRHREIEAGLGKDAAAVRIAQLEAEREIALRELDLSEQRTRATVLLAASALLLVIVAGLFLYGRARSRNLAALRTSHEKLRDATAQIQESEQRYRSLFFDAVVPKFLVDVESNRLVDANVAAARLCRVEPGDLQDLPVESLEPVWLRRVATQCRGLTADETVVTGFQDFTQRERSAEVKLAPVTVRGRPSVVVSVHDVTEERRLEQERIRVDKLESLGLLAGGIAHDFNNALSVILGYVGLAKLEAGAGSQIEPLLQEAEEAVDQSTHLTQQLLAFARGGEPRRELIDVREQLRKAVGFAMSGASVGFELQIDDDLWPAELDLGQFKQLVSNLVINGVQAMGDRGTLRVAARNMPCDVPLGPTAPAGDYVRIDVADSGPGIPAKIRDKVMDPYFTTKEAGSGLGLATSFAIVSRHEGWLAFETREGEGTTFSVYLPASRAAQLRVVIPAEEVPLASGSERVLIMDDDASIRRVYRTYLEQWGYRVDVAEDGEEAVAKYTDAMRSGRPFDLVIMDLTVAGGMGGQAAMEILRREDPDVRAIVASGYSNATVMADHERYGFRAALGKPFQLEEIARVVRSGAGVAGLG